ncbi:MAG: hypothetical protein K5746_03045 [Clostridiales bacterium]|nr:hypothetical protein [Clostridiales bacterium]
MEGNEILNNLRTAFDRVMRMRLCVSSPAEKIADVPIVYSVLLALATPGAAVLALVLGWIRKYSLRVETRPIRRE